MPITIENRVPKRYSGNDTQFIVPEGVTVIGEHAFYGYTSLTQINIPDSVTKISNAAFKGSSSLSQITIPNRVTEIGESAFKNGNNFGYINVDSDSEIKRVQEFLPQDLKAKVTSFYCKHVANIKALSLQSPQK